jgi:hypothetical protein
MMAIRDHLASVLDWATKVQAHLAEVQEAHRGAVHFRPSSGGVAMVGLHPERPQRGKSQYRNLARLRTQFAEEYAKHCVDVAQGRPTPEKRLQSFLISDAYRHGRSMAALNHASSRTDDPVELAFVTDELALPAGEGKIVCDILAMRQCDDGRCVPVVMELKSERQMTRLVEQVDTYARLIHEHLDLVTELYGILLGRPMRLEGPPEKWIVWPHPASGRERREDQLAEAGIRVAGYRELGDGVALHVGRAPGRRPPGAARRGGPPRGPERPMTAPSKELLQRHHVWVGADTAFRRRARLHQALWRERMGYPMGHGHGKPRGDRLAMPWAQESLANYLTPTIQRVVARELAAATDGQVYQVPRIYEHLLSSQPLCFNLFGEMAEDLKLATAVFRRRVPDLERVTAVRFEHSPGRGNPTFLGDGTAHDVFVDYQTRQGARAFVGIEVKYVEDMKAAPARHKRRYDEVAAVMGEFRADALPDLERSPLEQIWRDHLLAGSILQAGIGYTHGTFVFMYPDGNAECADAVEAYGRCLEGTTTFQAWTLEGFVEDIAAVHEATAAPARERYVVT